MEDGFTITVSGHKIILDKSSLLYEKTDSSIPKGSSAIGWLYFYIKGISNDIVMKNYENIHVAFEDSYGNKYNASCDLKATNNPDVEYWPGSGKYEFQKKQ